MIYIAFIMYTFSSQTERQKYYTIHFVLIEVHLSLLYIYYYSLQKKTCNNKLFSNPKANKENGLVHFHLLLPKFG